MKKLGLFLLSVVVTLLTSTAQAAELRIAVAANFNGTLQQLANSFEQQTNHKVILSAGSSGALYAQIQNSAPFDIFFSADSRRPELLVSEGLALSDSLFTYAIGVPVLWSADDKLIDAEGKVLRQNRFRYLALANPDNAPYGFAGQQVLTQMGLWDQLNTQQKIVRSQNIGQAHSHIASGAAELGFIALAQIMHSEFKGKGSMWIPPANSYDPIVQKAVILQSATDKQLAADFMAFIRSPESAAVIREAGYALDKD
ncbi:MAG: molybdate ABC transporter substrate-binding protein [Marinospirillum sp.]|uniref:molybdate ABC transporter substrate-binding protein n=1 Tax=Marinospirillum sp. TaxID=2183934 RepID=UPI0019E118E9|nr:molybdate ABC transporter substrate-binding protein [Marinospirillum sp.]MBE0507982.1 molybdate ABC transporter substrate-binding protein [Marinospirillum sp.]